MSSGCFLSENMLYGSFSERFHHLAQSQRIPVNGTFEVTMRCNMRCKHCYIPMGERARNNAPELTLREYDRIFGEIADEGCLWILLTGGEPFLRPDFLSIYDNAKRHGFLPTIFTNGTLLNKRIIDHLDEFRPFNIEISLYGATQETYENLTGIPGSFAKCIQAIELILERGLPLKLKSVLLTLNQDELQKMKLLSESYGKEFYFDPVINPGLKGDLSPTQYRLRPEEIVDIQAQDSRIKKAWSEIIRLSNTSVNHDKHMYLCGAGRTGFHLDAHGKLSICMSSREPGFDLRKGTFHEAWHEFIPKIINQQFDRPFECQGCELRTLCMQCPALAVNENGDAAKPVRFLCELAHRVKSRVEADM